MNASDLIQEPLNVSEVRGSWVWGVSLDLVSGKVAFTGVRSGRKAVELAVFPLEATGVGEWSYSMLVGWLGGRRLKHSWDRMVERVFDGR